VDIEIDPWTDNDIILPIAITALPPYHNTSPSSSYLAAHTSNILGFVHSALSVTMPSSLSSHASNQSTSSETTHVSNLTSSTQVPEGDCDTTQIARVKWLIALSNTRPSTSANPLAKDGMYKIRDIISRAHRQVGALPPTPISQCPCLVLPRFLRFNSSRF